MHTGLLIVMAGTPGYSFIGISPCCILERTNRISPQLIPPNLIIILNETHNQGQVIPDVAGPGAMSRGAFGYPNVSGVRRAAGTTSMFYVLSGTWSSVLISQSQGI